MSHRALLRWRIRDDDHFHEGKPHPSIRDSTRPILVGLVPTIGALKETTEFSDLGLEFVLGRAHLAAN